MDYATLISQIVALITAAEQAGTVDVNCTYLVSPDTRKVTMDGSQQADCWGRTSQILNGPVQYEEE